MQHPETVGHGPQLFQTFSVHQSPVTKVKQFGESWDRDLFMTVAITGDIVGEIFDFSLQ